MASFLDTYHLDSDQQKRTEFSNFFMHLFDVEIPLKLIIGESDQYFKGNTSLFPHYRRRADFYSLWGISDISAYGLELPSNIGLDASYSFALTASFSNRYQVEKYALMVYSFGLVKLYDSNANYIGDSLNLTQIQGINDLTKSEINSYVYFLDHEAFILHFLEQIAYFYLSNNNSEIIATSAKIYRKGDPGKSIRISRKYNVGFEDADEILWNERINRLNMLGYKYDGETYDRNFTGRCLYKPITEIVPHSFALEGIKGVFIDAYKRKQKNEFFTK